MFSRWSLLLSLFSSFGLLCSFSLSTTINFIVFSQIFDIFNCLHSFHCSTFLFFSFIVTVLQFTAYWTYLFYWVFVLRSIVPQNYYSSHCYYEVIDAFPPIPDFGTAMLIFIIFCYEAEHWVSKFKATVIYMLINFHIIDLIMFNEVSSTNFVFFIDTELSLFISVLINSQVIISIDLSTLVWISNHYSLGFCFYSTALTALSMYSSIPAYSIVIQLPHLPPYAPLYLIVCRLRIYVICPSLLRNLTRLPCHFLMLYISDIISHIIYSFLLTLNSALIFDLPMKISIYYLMLFSMMLIFLVGVDYFFDLSIEFIHPSNL